MMRRMLIAAACWPATSHAAAQTYPSKPVTLVLPYAAGGNTDAIARTLANRLEQRLGPAVRDRACGSAPRR